MTGVEELEPRPPDAGRDLVRNPEDAQQEERNRRRSQRAADHGSREQRAVASREAHGSPNGPDRPRADRPQFEQALEVVGERARARVAALGLGLQRLRDDGGEVAREPLDNAVQGSGAALDLPEDLRRRPALEREGAAQRVVEHRAERVHVRARVEAREIPAQLLGRGVGRRTEERPGPRLQGPALLAHQAEVGEHGRAVATQEDVGGLHVAVHETLRVHRLERAADLQADAAQVARHGALGGRAGGRAEDRAQVGEARRRPARGELADQVGQRDAVDPLHRVRAEARLGDDVVDGDDAGVGEAPEEVRFAQEALALAGGERRVEGERLQGDDAPAHAVLPCEPDDSHAAPAELAEDLEAGDARQGARRPDDDRPRDGDLLFEPTEEVGTLGAEVGGRHVLAAVEPLDRPIECLRQELLVGGMRRRSLLAHRTRADHTR